MSIRVGLRHMARALGPVAPPPPVWPMEYVFTEGTASPYDIKYDNEAGLGPYLITTAPSTSSTSMQFQRKLVRLSDGTLYVIYAKGSPYQIYVAKSVDNGETWTDETLISTRDGMASYDQNYPSIAVDLDDNLHAVWCGKATGYTTDNQIWYAKYDGSWSTPVRISTRDGMSDYEQFPPSIAVDSAGNLHVVWYGRATGYTAWNQVWYAKYDGSWSTPLRISTYSGMENYSEQYACIAIDLEDNIHVTFFGAATGFPTYYQIWHVKYNGSWSTPVRISTAAGMNNKHQYNGCLAIDSNNHLHAVWYGKAAGDTRYQIYYAKYDGSWQTPVRISTAAGMEDYNQQYSGSIAVDSDGHLYVVWYGKATGYTDYNKIWLAIYTDSWATPIVLQPIGENVNPNLRWSRIEDLP